MGIQLDKIRLTQHPMTCPLEMVQHNKAGYIYFVQHKPKTDPKVNECANTENEIGKRSHYALAVDITGSSTHDKFVATHSDLYVYGATNHKTYIKTQLKTHDWNDYAKVKLVGCIPLNDILAFDEPIRYAKELEYLLLRYVYDPLYQRNAGAKWSSILNCQTYTRSAIQYLGAQFPEEVEVISDCIPVLFDIYLNTALMAAVTTQETHEKISA